ncbi:hypothetical protein LC612_39010, partial [Nostoc sp. CHAB 5834]|nr:hypothetical protein [Nostoc sp. CHAB 5834]
AVFLLPIFSSNLAFASCIIFYYIACPSLTLFFLLPLLIEPIHAKAISMLKKNIKLHNKITGFSCIAYIKELGLLIFLANSNLFVQGVIAVCRYNKNSGSIKKKNINIAERILVSWQLRLGVLCSILATKIDKMTDPMANIINMTIILKLYSLSKL